ncbi:hypothetical protein IV203_013680 [Nitzschia inconspicua]|uniref:Uncharacterized protein n=1 Tax=Nitzschia inconspicua TaxID=303405 RepID=A0A9K3M6A3_9STRA|nr:hypothetical protein IV203_013680 [Nitzschia inconspicua]
MQHGPLSIQNSVFPSPSSSAVVFKLQPESLMKTTLSRTLEILLSLLIRISVVEKTLVTAGYAPNDAPKLPEGFCKHGDITATTGECMCHWQHKDGCKGAGCQYQMGLSFYHYSCNDCECVPEP